MGFVATRARSRIRKIASQEWLLEQLADIGRQYLVACSGAFSLYAVHIMLQTTGFQGVLATSSAPLPPEDARGAFWSGFHLVFLGGMAFLTAYRAPGDLRFLRWLLGGQRRRLKV
jgi:hypothetical protein